MPVQFENCRKFDGKNSLQDFHAKEMELHPQNRSVSFQKRRKLFCFHHFRVFTRCRFQNVPISVPFSKSAGKKMPFLVNGRPVCHIFHRFQNVPASCEHSLRIFVANDSLFYFLFETSYFVR